MSEVVNGVQLANAAVAAVAGKPAVGDVLAPKQPDAPVIGEQPTGTPPKDAEFERRAAAIARAKREASKNQAEREKLTQERALFQGQLKKAEELERLAKLQKENPLQFAKEIGLDINELSQRYIEDASGSTKTPAELARVEASKVIEEYKASLEAQRVKEQAENLKRRDEQIYAGVKRELGELIKKDPARYELIGDSSEDAVSRAFNLVVKFHNLHQGKEGYAPLAFDKALDAVEDEEVEKAAKRAKSAKLAARLAAEKVEPAKAAAAKPSRDVEASNVETPKQSPSLQRKRRGVLDVRKMADELVQARKASLDT